MEQPLVSVICTIFNQGKFIRECLDSVLLQSYPNIELIIIENGSRDGGKAILEKFLEENKSIACLFNPENQGLPKAFNQGFKISSGSYIMDLAGDDTLEPEAITKLVERFSGLENNYGVVFSNAMLIDEKGEKIKRHFLEKKSKIPEGYIFPDLLSKYLICPPTMLIRREVINSLGGYDEDLVYEDFDFWVRSSRQFKYAYLDFITVRKRMHEGSFSKQIFNPEFEESTYKVCEKASKLIKTEIEKKALRMRLDYHIRQCILMKNRSIGKKYLKLRAQLKGGLFSTILIRSMWEFPFLTRSAYFLLKSSFSTNPR